LKLEKSLATATFIMIVTVAVWAALRPDLVPLFNLVLLAGLIAVTTIYAYSTIQISRATKDQSEKIREQAEATRRQADASVKMAEETKKQRYSECLPLLVPSIPPVFSTDELPYESLQSGIGMKVIWSNAGKGAAINSRFSFYPAPTSSGKAEAFPSRRLGTLEVGGKKEVDFDKIFERYWQQTKLLNDKRWHQISDEYQPRLEAEYQDIYERHITTVQEFRIEDHDNNKRAFLGELYFTVNGRRLGEETAQHD
jgi:hypothetical protein